MAWKKKQIVMRAFSEIGKTAYEFDLNPEAMQSGLADLDMLLAEWGGAANVRVGYAGGDGFGDINADSLISRVNGVQTTSSSSDQGTGNYGNYPLYIGRRNNASLPFNGNLYSMIIVGKAVTAGELSSAETWVNGKTGAYA